MSVSIAPDEEGFVSMMQGEESCVSLGEWRRWRIGGQAGVEETTGTDGGMTTSCNVRHVRVHNDTDS